MKALTNDEDPYWNPLKRTFTGFQLAGNESETPFGKLMQFVKQDRNTQNVIALFNYLKRFAPATINANSTSFHT